jgi:hypothetical protein
MVETTDGLSETTLFAYDGNKITSINSPNSRTDFTYTDGLISKIVLLNKKTKIKEIIEYSYDLGNLVQVESEGKYVIKYIHNPKRLLMNDFQVVQTIKCLKNIMVLSVENGNLMYDKRILMCKRRINC